jgi:hypothetical protein
MGQKGSDFNLSGRCTQSKRQGKNEYTCQNETFFHIYLLFLIGNSVLDFAGKQRAASIQLLKSEQSPPIEDKIKNQKRTSVKVI